MFRSFFNVSVFDMINHNLLMFGTTLRRRKFPADVRVHTADTSSAAEYRDSNFFLSLLICQNSVCDLTLYSVITVLSGSFYRQS